MIVARRGDGCGYKARGGHPFAGRETAVDTAVSAAAVDWV